MRIWLPLLLQSLAFAVALGEIILPSFGILAVLCAGLFAWSWQVLFSDFGTGTRAAFAVADVILIPIFIRYAFKYLGKSPISHTTDLGTGSGLEAVDQALQKHVGSTATVDAPLRPTGRIRIGDETFEASTSGEFVERGASVKVLSVVGSRFTVEKPAP